MRRKDPTEFRQRFAAWKAKKKVYDAGKPIPQYDNGTDDDSNAQSTNTALAVPGIMLANEIIKRVPITDPPKNIQDARFRLYNQVSPAWGFTDDTVKAFFDTMVHNTNNFYEAYKNKETDEFGKPAPPIVVDDPYVDTVWAEYLQIPKNKRRYDYRLKQSKYRPTRGDSDNLTYYKIPIDAETTDALIRDAETLPIGKNKLSTTLMGYNHGEHTVGKGVDPEKGEYVSYYDRWDLNPLSSRYSAESRLSNNRFVKMFGLLDNKKYGDLSFGLGKPLEFYDRIYLDDYYGVKQDPSEYKLHEDKYGGYLPEIFVDYVGNGQSTISMGNRTVFGVSIPESYDKGKSIHINPANKGKFNATKKRTGKTTEQLAHSKNPLTRKRAIFALNARKWKH